MNHRTRQFIRLAAAPAIVSIALLSGCGDDINGPPPPPPPPPSSMPGILNVRIDQAPTGTGGLIFMIAGNGLGTLEGTVSGIQLKVLSATGGTVRAFVRGNLTPGLIGRIAVARVDGNYAIQVIEAAGSAPLGYAQIPPGAIRLSLPKQ